MLCALSGHDQAVTTPERLQGFFDGLAPAVAVAVQAQKVLDRVAATNFSVFHYFKENENLVSGIFADLLRPDGSHGQGTAFLRLFLQEIDRGGKDDIRSHNEYDSLERCVVHTEYPIPRRTLESHCPSKGGKIDIVLKLGDAWIGVENKPWAVEQPNQIQRYLCFLQKEDAKACVLYLSGDGDDAKTIQDKDKDHYLTIPYGRTKNGPSVAHWVAECHRCCEADKVRWFLKDLHEYIVRMFYAEEPERDRLDRPRRTTMNTSELSARYIRKKQKRLRMALHVYEAMPAVRQHLIKEIFKAACKRVAKELDGETHSYDEEGGRWFWTKQTGDFGVFVKVGCEREPARWLVAGVYVGEEKSIGAQRNEMQSRFDTTIDDLQQTWGHESIPSETEIASYFYNEHVGRLDKDKFLRQAILKT